MSITITEKKSDGYYVRTQNGPRKVVAMYMGHKGKAYKFIGMETKEVDGVMRRVAIHASENDPRNPTPEEMEEYRKMSYRPIVQFI